MTKSYPAYKDTGIVWLGNVPNSWGIKRIKHNTYVKGRIGWQGLNSDEYGDVGVYLVTGTDFDKGRIDWDNCHRISEERYAEDPYIQLQDKDLLITKDGTIGKIALVDKLPDKATLNSGVFVTRPKTDDYITPFMYWVLNSNAFNVFIDYTKTGSTIQHLYQQTFVEFSYPVPSLPEQQAIADFLDRKTAQIDTLIEKKQQQIDLLQEQRTALINHAVTKGLNPEVRMKDSGVEWYGSIPQHWDMKRLGRITSVIMDIDHKMPLAVEKGVPFLSAKDLLNDGTLNFENDVKKISEEDFQKLSRKVQPQRHDIIYSRIGARLGKARLVETDQKFLVSYSCCVVRVIEEMALPEYIRFIMDSEILLTEAKARTVGIGVPDLGLGEIAKFPIPLPPKPEQEAILEFLNKNDAKIKTGIKDISKQIDLLNEYRTALISEAVTGKIDVRTAE